MKKPLTVNQSTFVLKGMIHTMSRIRKDLNLSDKKSSKPLLDAQIKVLKLIEALEHLPTENVEDVK